MDRHHQMAELAQKVENRAVAGKVATIVAVETEDPVAGPVRIQRFRVVHGVEGDVWRSRRADLKGPGVGDTSQPGSISAIGGQ